MTLTKLNPWNWFKREEDRGLQPVRGGRPLAGNGLLETPFRQLHREIDRIMEDFARHHRLAFPAGDGVLPTHADGPEWLHPALNISETEKEYTISVELPGVDREDVSIEVVGDSLRITGEKKEEAEEKEKGYHRIERSYGSFQRVLDLPEDANGDAVVARMKNGVLTVTIPRKEGARPSSRRIEVQAA